MKCPYCGSERVELSISWGQTAEAGNVGLEYNSGKGFFVLQVLLRCILTSA